MKTVEEIVKHKAYFELTPAEKEIINDVAPNEEAFDNLKFLLEGTTAFYQENKVTAGSEMRDHIMEKLYPPTNASIPWYHSFWLFLVPPQKPIYQYPIFQLATLVILFLGVFTLWQNPFKTEDLAQNNKISTKVEGKTPTEKQLLIEENKESEEIINDNSVSFDEEKEEVEPRTTPLEVVVATDASRPKEAMQPPSIKPKDFSNNEPLKKEVSAEPMMEVEEILDMPSLADNEVSEMDKKIGVESDVSRDLIEVQSSSKVFSSKKESKRLNDVSSGLSQALKTQKTLKVNDLKDLKGLFFEVK